MLKYSYQSIEGQHFDGFLQIQTDRFRPCRTLKLSTTNHTRRHLFTYIFG